MGIYFFYSSLNKTCNGGLVSPSGDSFIGGAKNGLRLFIYLLEFTSARVLALDRTMLDEKLVKAARREGVTFLDQANIQVMSAVSERLTIILVLRSLERCIFERKRNLVHWN